MNPSWWKRRTSMERCLIFTTAAAFVIGISLVVVLVSHSRNKQVTTLQGNTIVINGPDGTTEEICVSPGCTHTASRVLEYMDPTVDPCDDFYEFTCGNFLKKTNIPDDKSSVTSFSIINDMLREQLRTIIEEPIRADEPKPFQLTKKLYLACMNETLIESKGLDTIKSIFKKLGGWPVLEGVKWREADFNWKESVYKFRENGFSINYFINFFVGVDLKNSTKRLIFLDQPPFNLPREFLINGLNDTNVKAYYNYMVDIAVLFGADKRRAVKELKESLEFEKNLANISLPNEERRNISALYNPMTVKELQMKFSSIPWIEYINTILAPDTNVTNDEVIVVLVPSYIKKLAALAEKTLKRVQANYVMWKAAASSVPFLTETLRERRLKYAKILIGNIERPARWKECTDVAIERLDIALGALYIRKYFNEKTRQNAKEMVADIRAEFQDIVKNVGWMDDETRQNALDKAKSMATRIAYPDEMLDNNKLEQIYDGLELDPNQYLQSILNVTLFGTRFSIKRLRQPVNKTDWITLGRPTDVNAFYLLIENSMQLPAGILQGVFFNADRPKYMNYGAIGFIIGHEITHGFDDQGRQFDKNGKLVNWWQEGTKEAFDRRAKCIIDQYRNYSVAELKLNLTGIKTQGENIADSGGIKVAYSAYNKWLERNGDEPYLPGLRYTGRQMFWISAGSIWCSKTRIEALQHQIVADEHAPNKYRVIVPLSNTEHFAKDFNCPIGSKMNPKEKCSIW